MKCIDIINAVETLRPWYHTIKLVADGGEVIYTTGEPYFDVWQNIRKARDQINYQGKTVLDLATFDGLWAFEAEQLGASMVIATDCNWEAHRRFLFCRGVLNSKVVPLLNVPVHELVRRLDFYLRGHASDWKAHDPKAEQQPTIDDPRFDIVQHLGLFYHLRDPLFSLLQCRSVIKDGGHLLLETAFLRDELNCVMAFNPIGADWHIYNDETTWWAPSLSCLREVLRASAFEMVGEPKIMDFGEISRICLCATATPFDQINALLYRELRNTYRTPGLEL